MERAFLGAFMKKRDYPVKSITAEIPSLISDGLDNASEKFNISKSDIIRSVLYDFLTTSGIIPYVKEFDSQDDKSIECVGRQPSLLSME